MDGFEVAQRLSAEHAGVPICFSALGTRRRTRCAV
jgi:hypothetical protein